MSRGGFEVLPFRSGQTRRRAVVVLLLKCTYVCVAEIASFMLSHTLQAKTQLTKGNVTIDGSSREATFSLGCTQ